MGNSDEISREDFERYFPFTPTALCVKECARLTALRKYACPGPILDVGCGDGLFATIAFENVEVWGIDIDAKEGRWAASSRAYSQVILGDVTRAKLPEGFFQSCVANCSLEHVPRIDLALENILRSLKPGGTAYLFLPNRDWTRHLLSTRLLEKVGAPALAKTLRDSIDRFFRHHHLHDQEGWRKVVSDAGLEVLAVDPVLSSATTVAFEAFLLPSLLGWTNKHLTARWTNFPRFRKALAAPVYVAVSAIMGAAEQAPTAEFLVVARRPRSERAVAEAVDYFSNHSLKLRFPWSLYHAPIVRELSRAVERSPGPEVLNIGSGPFLERESLSRGAARRFTVCDIDPRAIELARQIHGPALAGADVIEAGRPLPYPASRFDLVVAMDVVEHIIDPLPWVVDAVRVLRPGGTLFLTTPNYASRSLTIIEKTALELIARIQGFSRRHLHPTKFDAPRLRALLGQAGLADPTIREISLGWVLAAHATKRPT